MPPAAAATDATRSFGDYPCFSAWDVVQDFLYIAASRVVDMSFVLRGVDLEQNELLGR
jgi:hypothetical protein